MLWVSKVMWLAIVRIDEHWTSSFPSEFRENYVKTEIKDCDEANVYDEVDQDGK